MAVSSFDVNAFVYDTSLAIPPDGETSTVELTSADINIDKLYFSTLSATASDDANGDGNFDVGETVTLTNYAEAGQLDENNTTTTSLTVLGSGTYTWTSFYAPHFGGTVDVLVTTTDGTDAVLVFVGGTQDSHVGNNFDSSGSPYFGELINSNTLTWQAVGYSPSEGAPLCFAADTLISTVRGPVAIQDLAAGDQVLTVDSGAQAIRWIGSRRLGSRALARNEKLRPIRIRKDALGNGVPSADLVVSPQHRILVRSNIAQKMFGTDEVLVAAKQLCQLGGIDIADDLAEVTYYHMLFDKHEVVIANGARTESLYTGPEAIKSVGLAAREEIYAIFPELRNRDYSPAAARKLVSGRMGRRLAVRHKENNKALVI